MNSLAFRLFPIVFALAYYSMRLGDNVILTMANALRASPVTVWVAQGLDYLSEYFHVVGCPASYERDALHPQHLYSLLYFLITWHYIGESVH